MNLTPEKTGVAVEQTLGIVTNVHAVTENMVPVSTATKDYMTSNETTTVDNSTMAEATTGLLLKIGEANWTSLMGNASMALGSASLLNFTVVTQFVKQLTEPQFQAKSTHRLSKLEHLTYLDGDGQAPDAPVLSVLLLHPFDEVFLFLLRQYGALARLSRVGFVILETTLESGVRHPLKQTRVERLTSFTSIIDTPLHSLDVCLLFTLFLPYSLTSRRYITLLTLLLFLGGWWWRHSVRPRATLFGL